MTPQPATTTMPAMAEPSPGQGAHGGTHDRSPLLRWLLAGPLPAAMGRRLLRVWTEAALSTAAALGLARVFATEQAGVISIFLTGAALVGRFDDLLDENRRLIRVEGRSASRVNRVTAYSLVALLAGMFSAYVAAGLILGEGAADAFRFAIRAAHLGQESILTRRFGSLSALLAHNYAVLLSVFVLGLLYRSYGALLALGWNASVWGIALAFLIERGIRMSMLPGIAFVTLAWLTVLPHLLLEATGYVAAALAAIFLSLALAKYRPSEAIFQAVVRASIELLALAIAAVMLAGLVESTLPPRVLPYLR